MIKALGKLGIEGKYLNIIKVIYIIPTASIVLTSEKLKPFPLNRNETRMPTIPTLIQHSSGITSQSN
jgi:hypothetical protein